ncbi:probable G-protein coupled receptor Mth-like 1 isoform X2 [Belonocnema kinseyi]|nr:probable G-protein coupled receptor Mth-like 1 isoform X2 [Belonocnema kinseyi]
MVSSSLAERDCCPKDVIWESGKNCSDGSQVLLDCPNEMYMMDQNDPSDQFSVTNNENGTWLVLTSESDETRIPQNEFCIFKKNLSDKLIALVCFGETQNSEWKYILFGSLSVTSSFFLFITFVVYLVLPELREIQDKAMMSAVASLSASYMILAIQHLRKVELPTDEKIIGDVMCVPLAFFMYYAFLSAFFWLNLVAFNIWRLVWFKSFPIKETILFAAFCVIGWGAPLCFLIAALVIHFLQDPNLQPLFGKAHCWFKGDFETMAYFYGPISILLTINVVYLSLTCWRLWHEYQESSGNKIKLMRKKCLLYVKLILVMGVTWIFEIIAFFTEPHHEAWVLTDVLNSLQGVIIFIIFVVTRKRVRKLLAQKKPFGINFPKSWTAYEDEECEEIEIVFSEQVELSQPS